MKICCIGDSLTEGDYGIFGKKGIANVQPENYPFFLAQLTNAEVINYGKCGIRATGTLKNYQAGLIDVKGADYIIIMLGTNGGNDPDCDTPDNAAYIELVRRCRQDASGAKIILCTPPHATVNPEMSNCGYADQVEKAVLFVRKVAAAESGVELLDVARCPSFTSETEAVMQPNDGIHFGKVGYQTLASFIYESVFA